jgi:hypothetical protein
LAAESVGGRWAAQVESEVAVGFGEEVEEEEGDGGGEEEEQEG